jgi:hypothetical protein
MKKIAPTLTLLLVLILAAVLGYGWGVSDVQIADTGPWQMHVSYQGIYAQAVADAFASDANESQAIERLSFLCQTDGGLNNALQAAIDRYGGDPVKRRNIDQLRTLIQSGKVVVSDGVPVCDAKAVAWSFAFLNRGLTNLIAMVGIGLMALIIVVAGVLQIARGGEDESVAPARSAGAPAAPGERAKATIGGKPAASQETARSVAAQGAKISATIEKTDFVKVGTEPPIVQFMTTYLHGDDLYDDSFSIETPAGEFLGETGVGISETLSGAGEAKKVTAFEVWLFDKNDIRTVTKVVMSDHAFNDDAIRAKLAAKGEAVLAKPGDKITLETATLRIQARLVDLAYGSGPVPPNSFYERITIELAAWKREGGQPVVGGGTPPSGLPSMG